MIHRFKACELFKNPRGDLGVNRFSVGGRVSLDFLPWPFPDLLISWTGIDELQSSRLDDPENLRDILGHELKSLFALAQGPLKLLLLRNVMSHSTDNWCLNSIRANGIVVFP